MKWEQIEHFNYVINELGVVWNTKFDRPVKPFDNGNGYMAVDLFHKGQSNVRQIHRLLMQYFGEGVPKEHVNHKDGNPKNNSLDNLEWATSSENHQHRFHVLNLSAKRGTDGRFQKHNKIKKELPL